MHISAVGEVIHVCFPIELFMNLLVYSSLAGMCLAKYITKSSHLCVTRGLCVTLDSAVLLVSCRGSWIVSVVTGAQWHPVKDRLPVETRPCLPPSAFCF